MLIDGLRAWIGEVERKLLMRTRVFLVLAVIAIGAAGAALYFAIDTRQDAVSEGDVQQLQQQLEGQVQQGTVGAPSGELSTLEAQVKALQAEVKALKGGKEGGAGSK